MLNVVIVMQEENWGDDGGEHDPVLVSLTPSQFALVSAMEASVIGSAQTDKLKTIISAAPKPSLPCVMHGVFNIWHSYST